MEKVYYYEDRTKPPVLCEIDEINVDGTVEVMDLSDGRMIRTRIENLGKVIQPAQAVAPAFNTGLVATGLVAPQIQTAPLEKVSIFDVEEEKAEEDKEDDGKDENKNDGEKKIIINIKPE